MTENEAIEVLKEKYKTMSMCLEIEECKRNNQSISKAISALQEVQQYRSIGTVEECREAMERQRAKKPILYKGTNRVDCPVCGNTVKGIGKPFGNWCSHCGQAIDWSDTD